MSKKFSKIVTLLLAFTMTLSLFAAFPSVGVAAEVAKFPTTMYEKPTVTPPPEHPRLLFRASDLETIKKNMESAELKPAVDEFNRLKERDYTGILPEKEGGANYDSAGLSVIEAKAFDYALNGNEENGKEAITAILNYADTCTYTGLADNTRNMGHVLFTAAEVYDWCYPLWDKKDREKIVARCQEIGKGMEIGSPPVQQSSTGHGGEMQLLRDWLSLAVATYDEYPDIYTLVGGKYFQTYIDGRNFWSASGTHDQGTAYGLTARYEPELWGQWIIYRMTGGQTWLSDDMGQVPYEMIYKRRPDGQFMREGDEHNEYKTAKNAYWTTLAGPMFYASSFYKDPILKKEFLKEAGFDAFSTAMWSRTAVQYIIFDDPSVGTKDFTTLPLTKYFGSPSGSMVARTGWGIGMESPDVFAYMKIGEHAAGGHYHADAGNFQIYYKGILASDSGWYDSYGTDHHYKYTRSTFAHNTLLIGSSKNPAGNQRELNETYNMELWVDSGKYETGEVLGYEFGPDVQYPEYNYISGDIAKAYDETTKEVKEALRSMLFLPTEDEENPAVFVVFDKVETKSKKYKKSFMLHMQEEPSVDGNVSIIKRTKDGYNGKLVNQTLLPANAVIEKIGGEGKEAWVDGTNYPTLRARPASSSLEYGWGRLEIMPKKVGTEDYFLNVMYVTDADSKAEVAPAELIETETVAGAKIFDRVAIFNKEKARIESKVSFEVPGDEKELKVNVAGLKAGTWGITVNGKEVGTQISSEDGGIIYFTAPAGKYDLTYRSTKADKVFEDSGEPEVEGVTVMFNNNYLYSDVPPTIIDGRTLIPMRALLEALGSEVTWDEATATATAVKQEEIGQTKIVITENQKTVYVNDKPVELDVPAMIIDGRFMIPVRFVSEKLKAKVSWEEAAQRVKISATVAATGKWNIPNSIEVVKTEQSGDDGKNSIFNTTDGSFDSYWADDGKKGEAWGIFDLGEAYNIDSVRLSFLNGNKRVYSFDIAVSEDGKTYTDVLTDAKSSGKTTKEFEVFKIDEVRARYIKYIGRGNTENDWNSVQEIVITGKKDQIPNSLTVVESTQSGDDGKNSIFNSTDGSFNSYWADDGKDGEAWGIYDLGEVVTLDAVRLSFLNGHKRVYSFDIAVSEDGETYTDILKGAKSSGKVTNEFEIFSLKGVKARYVKYIGRGNSENLWNSVQEILFTEKK